MLPQPARQAAVIACIVLLAVSILFISQRALMHLLENSRASDPVEVTFVIEQDETVNSIAARLHEEKLIRSPSYFRVVLGFTGADKDIFAGEHLLTSAMTTTEIIDVITSEDAGSIQAVTIVFIEGWRTEQFAETLLAAELIESTEEFMAATHLPRWNNEFDFLHTRPSGVGLEGYLFPDTYSFRVDSSPEDIIQTLLSTFNNKVTPELRAQAAENGMTLHQAITLASIIEREAAVAEERGVIASVYTNRLAISIPLQADPTVQYQNGVPGDWWPVLTGQDLQRDGRYNTYLNPSLPPGPICNPGLASIEAALDPDETDYLFFVATGDGSHAFAVTFEEHQANIDQLR